uniref:Uncharacterized protein n=1 Tax=Anguilla anguilla TaxID=7936 RepID=A0A0E9QZ05_ANGAN
MHFTVSITAFFVK